MSLEIFWYRNKYLYLFFGFLILIHQRLVNIQCICLLLASYFVITFLVDYERNQKNINTPIIARLKEEIRPLISDDDFQRLVIHDLKDKFPSNKVAHTRSKSEIYMCTRKKGGESDEQEEFEKLVFVLIHELSHFVCDSCVQHDKGFQRAFSQMLKKADSLGIRYKESPKVCGVCVMKK